jgi:hypothetical protein
MFRIGPMPVSPITTRSESARHFDNCKEKSREILDWLINKGITANSVYIAIDIEKQNQIPQTQQLQPTHNQHP